MRLFELFDNDRGHIGSVYHATSIPSMMHIASTNEFRLSGIFASAEAFTGDRGFFKSTSRRRDGGFVVGKKQPYALIELDGDALFDGRQVKKFDYYKTLGRGNGEKVYDEDELRIINTKSIIPNATKYIKSIDITITDDDKMNEKIYQLGDWARSKNIPMTVYANSDALLRSDKTKVIEIEPKQFKGSKYNTTPMAVEILNILQFMYNSRTITLSNSAFELANSINNGSISPSEFRKLLNDKSASGKEMDQISEFVIDLDLTSYRDLYDEMRQKLKWLL